nr:hypothetical protein [Tanacetum cinerariifolium]
MNGPYVRRMIPKPGDPDREVPEIYAAVDSCETAQEIWLRVQQMMKGFDIGIQEKKAKLFNEWERLIVVPKITNQNLNGNGNVVAAWAEGNANEKNVQNLRVQNVGNQNRLIVVPKITNQNLNGNGNVVAAWAEGNANEKNEHAFSGTNGKDAVEHIEYFLKIVDPINLPNVDHDKLRIFVFPISLVGDPDLLTKDIIRFKTYEDYKDDWIHEWNKIMPWVYDRPWLDNGIWKEPTPVKHHCNPFNYKTGFSKWPTCSWRKDVYCNGGYLPRAYLIGNSLHYQDLEWYKDLMKKIDEYWWRIYKSGSVRVLKLQAGYSTHDLAQ